MNLEPGKGEPSFLSIPNGLRYRKQQKQESAMSQKRVVVVDGYNVVKLLRELDVSFEEIASLGCYVEGEPGKKLRPELHRGLVRRRE
jgi:hypothetical protein